MEVLTGTKGYLIIHHGGGEGTRQDDRQTNGKPAPTVRQVGCHQKQRMASPSNMASVIIVLVCLALPLAFTYRTKRTPWGGSSGRSPLPSRTAQSVHWRRRLQHAACGLAILWGYLWIITDAWTGRWSCWKQAPFDRLEQTERTYDRLFRFRVLDSEANSVAK